MKSRHASAAAASTGPVTASRAPGTSRVPATASPGRSRVLDGMQAQYEHSPPSSSRSTMATRRPPAAMAAAQCSPGAPPPSTMASKRSLVISETPWSLSAGQAGGDLLEHPLVAVGVAEPGERGVAAALRVRAGHVLLASRVVEDAVGVVEHLADVDAPLHQLRVGPHDVVHDQVQALC